MKINLISLILLLVITLNGQENPLVRFPAISPDGSQISFSYQGDIWTVARTGGVARRLTIHESYESHPQWSPDGKSIAFQGNRFGNNDLFVMKADGGVPKRLTFHSTSDRKPSWTNNNQLLFETTRDYNQLEWLPETHIVDANGGTPYRFSDAFGMEPSMSSDGRFVAFIRGECRFSREAYTGPANRNIWIFDTKNKIYHAVAENKAQESAPRWGKDHQLYFLSAASGRYNIYELSLDENAKANTQAKQLTHFTDEGIRHFDVSADGKHLVFERKNAVYSMAIGSDAKPEKINISLSQDDRFDAITHESFTSKAREAVLSPNEEQLIIGVRGELFVRSSDKDKKRTVQLTDHPYRDQNAAWLNDSTVIFISDRNGTKDLYLLRSADEEQPNLLKTLKHAVSPLTNTDFEEEDFMLSPNREQIIIIRKGHNVILSDIDSMGVMSNEKVLMEGWAMPKGLRWSPDSKWIAYAKEDLNFNSEIYIQSVDGKGEAVNVSMHPRADYHPYWSKDGSKLGFQSIRNNGDTDIWFAWLNIEDWEKSTQEWEDEDEEDEDKDEDTETPDIMIDLKNIHERLVQVTRFPGDEDDLVISPDGETFYFTTNNQGGDESSGEVALKSIQWDGTDAATLSDNMPLRKMHINEDGSNLFLLKRNGSIAKIKTGGGKTESLSFNAKIDINHAAERKQIIDEVWRSLNKGFYDPNFHGRDWQALRTQYEPLARSASTDQDFRDMLNLMLGQLNASHMGVFGRGPEETQKELIGYLGIEVKPVSTGVEVTRVVPHTAADRKISQLLVGDIINSVNGTAITPSTNFFALLINTRHERTLLEVTNTDGQQKEIVIRPTSPIRTKLYNEWVNTQKALTDKYSNGRLGYIHIRGMNWSSFERFERELTASGLGKEGIVIDVRFNGGGWTTDMLMAVLNVRQHAYTIPRGAAKNLEKEHTQFKNAYPYAERLPLAAMTKPTIALCNQASYSNAEIFSHAFKQLGHGTLVGMPTFGAVISTGGLGLINGSFVRMPFRAWYVKATGQNMELGPAVPNVQIENAPDARAKGEDDQLRKAVELLLEQL